MNPYPLTTRSVPLLAASLWLAVALVMPAAEVVSQLKSGDTITMCGDSITESKLYTLYLAEYFLMCQPAADLKPMQFGWGGETAHQFLTRIDKILSFNPTVATTFYGMNDGKYIPSDPQIIAKYRDSTTDIVRRLKKGGVRTIVVGSPGVVDTATFRRIDPLVYNQTLRDLSAAANEVADKEGVIFADVNAVMMEAMIKAKTKFGKDFVFAGTDGVHPGGVGHIVIAYAFLKALGCKGDIASIELDWSTQKAAASDGHNVLSSQAGTLQMESTKYPFCATDPTSRVGMYELVSFNKELNRFMLTVTNLPKNRATIFWGDHSAEVSKEELEAGVNLTEKISENPFRAQFGKVHALLFQHQNFETEGLKTADNLLDNWRKLMPGKLAEIDGIRSTLLDFAKSTAEAARTAVVPVKYPIRIEPHD